jgi:hypothetical protein
VGDTSKSTYVEAWPSSTGTGTNPLLDHFPFVNFQDAEVISLFEKLGFSLGSQEDIKIAVVTKFRSLLKSRFKKIAKDMHDKHASSIKDNALIDISDEILNISL